MDENVLFWMAMAAQMIGVVSLVFSRLGERIVAPFLARSVFVAAFLLVVASIAVVFCCVGGGWLTSGITLIVMAVGGTADFRPAAAEPAAF